MSLDVYLVIDNPVTKKTSGIYIRDAGSTREVSVEEWNARNPDRAVTIGEQEEETNNVFEYNITHNLGLMAGECDAYDALWRPDENGYTHARHIIEPLREGLKKLKSNPEHYKQFNPKNKWGDCDALVKFIERYLAACENYPNTRIEVSR